MILLHRHYGCLNGSMYTAFNLINGIDVQETEARIVKYKQENAAIIEENIRREEQYAQYLKEQEEAERLEREQRAEELRKIEEAERQERGLEMVNHQKERDQYPLATRR